MGCTVIFRDLLELALWVEKRLLTGFLLGFISFSASIPGEKVFRKTRKGEIKITCGNLQHCSPS